MEAGSVLCRLCHKTETNLEEEAELVEGAFRISSAAPEKRDTILEVVG